MFSHDLENEQKAIRESKADAYVRKLKADRLWMGIVGLPDIARCRSAGRWISAYGWLRVRGAAVEMARLSRACHDGIDRLATVQD